MKISKNLGLKLPEPNDTVRVLENKTNNFEIVDDKIIITPKENMTALVNKYKGVGA